jgi:hypothetical protein
MKRMPAPDRALFRCRLAVCLTAAACATLQFAPAATARTIQWSGRTWHVRTSSGNPQGPGPNIFSDSTENVFVDQAGDLHLKIRKGPDNKWLASEVDLNQSLTYGTYEFEVSSRYDLFATNVVGGLFTYLSPESVASQTGGAVGNGIPDTPHEIDIEFTKAWSSGHLYYTTHDGDVPAPSVNFRQALAGDFTTHRFTWEPGRIIWESFHGHYAGVANPPFPIVDDRPGANAGKPARHIYTGPVVPKDLNEIPIINFWISATNAPVVGPTGGAEQEMIVHSFNFTPLADSADFDRDGDVDGADLLTWQRGLGVGTTNVAGDADYNGAVNAADLAVWTEQFGQQLGAGIADVPEPATAALVTLGAFFLWRVAL